MLRETGTCRLANLYVLNDAQRTNCLLMVFQAYNGYVDESGTHDDASIIAVGGWIATYETWSAFEGEWRQKLAPHGGDFHSTDFWARQSYGADWPDSKRLEFVKELALIICKYSIWGTGIAFPRQHYSSIVPEDMRRALKNDPYYFALGHCMSGTLGMYYRIPIGLRPPAPLRFMFDRKPKREGFAAEVYYQVRDWFDGKGVLGDMAFGARKEEPALQAADLLVGELRRLREGKPSEVFDLIAKKGGRLAYALPTEDELKQRVEMQLDQIRTRSAYWS